jgi:hypothetical protein
MTNSYFIKNHKDSGFDKYYAQMKKKGKFGNSIGGQESPDMRRTQSPCKNIPNKLPAARDGHTGLIHNDQLIVFGGDRHHVPFNDTYMYDLGAEFDQRGDLE